MSGALAAGQLVELVGLPEALEAKDLLGTSDGSALADFRPNGKRGKVIGADDDTYTVETFDAVTLSVSRKNLKEYTPDAPAEGGFHLAWPSEGAGSAADFATGAVEALMKDGYCVVQMSMSDELRQQAVREASHMKYQRMKKEFEPAYLGRQFKCKTAWLEDLAEAKDQVLSALDRCDLHFSDFTKFMLPLAPCALGFVPYSRTNAMVRMPYQSNAEESKYQAEEVQEEDIEDGLVDSHINFVKRRTLCALFVIETGGGELTLISKDENKENVVLEVAKGHLIVFPHNTMSYIYNPFDSNDLVMQSWILQEPDQLTFVGLAGDQASKDEALGVHVGPNTPDGFRTNVFGFGVCFPGGSHGCLDAYWSGTSTGVDGQVGVPFHRFDMEIYSRAADEWFPGTSYAVHGGFMCEDIYAIDNELFGISEEEAYIMAPAHRMLLEKGYECLYRSGYRQGPGLQGRKIGVFVGHSGDDWSYTQTFTCGYEDKFKLAHSARVWGTLAGRIAYILGLKGPQALCDTACSSALVAYGVGHSMLRDTEPDQNSSGVDNKLNEAVMAGANLMPGPGNYINLCGPHMLSVMGRCFTFDHSADGFARGEGVGAFYVKNEAIMSTDAYATVIGACLNQDGRSASMTAPNGPSQQECIRGSMREAGLSANQVTCAECHGTGTALGDPIEVGALRGVMQDRVIPIIQTSAKAHIGHLEAGAGTAGIIKCMLMCAATSGSPNCHLGELNPHLDVDGYPTIFSTELTDYGFNSGYSGVSSFGFGGANSRADVFASSKRGPHVVGQLDWNKVDYISVTCPFDEGPMHYTDGKCVPRATSKKYKREPYHADNIRDEFASYDCNTSLYTGTYHMAPQDMDIPDDEVPKDPIWIVGSWDRFREAREMEVGDDGDSWYFETVLGETRCERFQLRVNNNPYEAIYPVVKNGSMLSRCIGPDEFGEGHYWLLDGRDAQVPAGTVFRITLCWADPPTMNWEKVESLPPDWLASCRHSYSVLGSWTGVQYEAMERAQDGEDAWEHKLRIGMTGMEWFRFARDKDDEQSIYPAVEGTGENHPVCGPDNMCNEKCWRIKGASGERVTLRLQVVDAQVTVTVLSGSIGTRVMHSVEGPKRHTYHVAGSWNDWQYEEMTWDPETLATFRYSGAMGFTGMEYFYISADADPGLTFFPEAPARYPGDCMVSGPDGVADGRLFSINCLKPGAPFEISFNRHAADKRRIVDIRWPEGRVDPESMKDAFLNFAAMGALSLGSMMDETEQVPSVVIQPLGQHR